MHSKSCKLNSKYCSIKIYIFKLMFIPCSDIQTKNLIFNMILHFFY